MMYSLIVTLGGLAAMAALALFAHSGPRRPAGAPHMTPLMDADMDSLVIPLAGQADGAEMRNSKFE